MGAWRERKGEKWERERDSYEQNADGYHTLSLVSYMCVMAWGRTVKGVQRGGAWCHAETEACQNGGLTTASQKRKTRSCWHASPLPSPLLTYGDFNLVQVGSAA